MATVGPFLKWAGGKGQLLDQYQAFLPKTLNGRGYVEPFLGSGAMFFHIVQTRQPDRCTLLDSNPELVNLFIQVRDRVETLIPVLEEHRAKHNAPNLSNDDRKTYYYRVRAENPEPGTVQAAARFLYLNKTCYNGLHRLNRHGRFNVPMGSYKNPTIFDAPSLRKASELLQGVRIESCDFRQAESFIGDSDFVYLDPPYEPLSRTSSFTAYAKEDFSREDQKALRDLLERISNRCDWMLSNSTAPLIEELYERPGWFKHTVFATRAINSKAGGRGRVPERVVTNY